MSSKLGREERGRQSSFPLEISSSPLFFIVSQLVGNTFRGLLTRLEVCDGGYSEEDVGR